MKTIRIAWIVVAAGACLGSGWAAQTVPSLVNYQGTLVNSDNSPLANGSHPVQFRIYDAITGGQLVWGPQSNMVPVYNGQFNVLLGPTDGASRSLADAFKGANRYLELQVSNSLPIAPRQQILSAPFALNAQTLNATNWGAVFDNGDPATGKIPGGLIAANSITGAQIIDGSIGMAELGILNRLSASDGNPTNAVYVNAVGNVGINTTSPAYLLDVNQGGMAVRGTALDTADQDYNVLPYTVITSNRITLYEAVKPYTAIGSAPGIAFRFTEFRPTSGPDSCSLSLTSSGKIRVSDADLLLDKNLVCTNLGSGTGTSLVLASDGTVKKSSSSRRYKEQIEAAREDFAKVLELEPKQYVLRDEPNQRQIGYLAEDLDELGLQALTVYDAQGRPDAIDYPRMVIYANEVLKQQQVTLQKQQEELQALKSEMEALKKLIKASR
jgi:hypothetical protein